MATMLLATPTPVRAFAVARVTVQTQTRLCTMLPPVGALKMAAPRAQVRLANLAVRCLDLPGSLQAQKIPHRSTTRTIRVVCRSSSSQNFKSTKNVSDEDALSNEKAMAIGDPTFVWTKNWYPCHVIDGMDESRPTKFTLMGIKMVLWKDGSGKWQAFEDECPHRLTPLSEGRIEEDGTLLCAYHGWRFSGDGTCTSIPQAESIEDKVQSCSNPRASAKAFPTRTDNGLLWVWPETGADGMLESTLKEPIKPPEYQADYEHAETMKVVSFPWGLRDLPYGWEAFIENVTDPAHVPVSHHNIMGSRYAAEPVFMPVHQSLTDEGFAVGEFTFTPPCLVRIELTSKKKKVTNRAFLTLYNVPTTPGHSRLIGNNLIVSQRKSKTKGKSSGMGVFTLPLPKWLLHILGTFFLHQDLVFLHTQEKNLAHADGQWSDACYLPTNADKANKLFRKWLEKHGEVNVHGKHAVPWKTISGVSSRLPPIESDPDKLFDVYNAHVKHCTHCQGALRNLKLLRLATICAAGAFAVRAVALSVVQAAMAAVTTTGQPPIDALSTASLRGLMNIVGFVVNALTNFAPQSAWVSCAISLTLAALALGLHKFIGLFFLVKFNHQDNK